MFMFLVIIEVRHSLLQKLDASGCIEVKLIYKILDNRPLLSLAMNYTCCEAGSLFWTCQELPLPSLNFF